MNERAFDRIAEAYLADGPTVLADRVLDAALDEVHLIRQRRVLVRAPWRYPSMNMYAKLAVAAVVVIAVGALGLAILGPAPGGVGGAASPSASATPSPSPMPTPTPTPTPLPELTETFTSDRYGISISYPTGWTPLRGMEPWTTGLPSGCDPVCADQIDEKQTDAAFIRVSSQALAGRAGEAWAEGLLDDPGWEATCPPETEPITIDGSPGILATQCPEGLLTAMAWDDMRGYLFVLYRIDDVAWFKEILSTVRLEPERAVDAAP
jgi:hypothetical protein